ncbi:hypothetical protein [Dokdonella sp.]|uniref:hypothetical protein n=1 Tax=Dokdonella sp. TaxID=2291710 RepID=UPI0037844640
MHSPDIDFRRIRTHLGSQHGGFEELVCQLAWLDTPSGMSFSRKGVGADAGLECYRLDPDGNETGWQAKYFFEFGTSEAQQLKESFDNAVDKHPLLVRFIACLPFDLSDSRIPKQKTEQGRWDDWVAARKKEIAPREIDIQRWGAFELTERLSRNDPLHVGRRTYWFDLPHFGTDWLNNRFAVARAALGRRYTPELNVELPIRQALAAFARHPEFACRILSWADHIEEELYRSVSYVEGVLGVAHAAEVSALKDHVGAVPLAIRSAALGPADSLPIDTWRSALVAAKASLDRCRSAIWDLRRTPGAVRDEPARNAVYFTGKLQDALAHVLDSIDDSAVRLANSRRLLLVGEAGVGKSHLLADVAANHISREFPAVLTLGSAFSDSEPWHQIAEQLGLAQTPPEAILSALDSAAQAAQVRALIMVDAINERNGIAVWSDRLAAFLAETDRFPHIAVLVSCRTTFVPYVVRQLDETSLPRLVHTGFAGKASDAARRYLDHRGIVRMAVPHLAPEFENPLFLRTCCDMLERRGLRELPRGLAGVSSIFDFYFGAVVEALNKRLGLEPRLKRIEKVLAALTEAMVTAGSGYLSFDVADAIVEAIHDSGGRSDRNLLIQLEAEGVLAVEPMTDSGQTTEMVRFTFERLSDHRIAEHLLNIHIANGNPVVAFTNGALTRYVAGLGSHRFAGIAEAFAVQLPERYGVELLDVVESKHRRNLASAFHISLLWRRQATFNQRTLELVRELSSVLGRDTEMEILLAITTEPDNLFNADYLDQWLRPLSMPERDVQWSIRVTTGVEDNDGPATTLIEWVLANGLDTIEPTRARLAATALAWLTSLSHRWVRDRATKALAALLVDRRELAATLIDLFGQVDDAYVVDRVLAAAYGGATRRSTDSGLPELALSAYKAVFARDPLPVHALIRDHARGIIELAASRGVLPPDIPLARIRPPYAKGAPLENISDEAMAGYVQFYEGSPFRDAICGSAVEDGDFARYVIDPLAGRFLRLPLEEFGRSVKELYEDWHAAAIASHPGRVEALSCAIQLARQMHSLPKTFEILLGDKSAEERGARRLAEDHYNEAIARLIGLLDEKEIEEFRIRAARYISEYMWNESAQPWYPSYAGHRARRWVAWRAHELGWATERFAEFDAKVASHDRMEHRVERIGKKYQWIALHELTGRLADSALVEARYREGPELYAGPSQVGTREMDPTILVTRTAQNDSDRQGGTWWTPHTSRWRNDPPQARVDWAENTSLDIPDAVRQIEITDPKDRRWLVLDTSVGRNQWAMVGGQRIIHRMTWHKVQSLLVARSDVESLVRLLKRSKGGRSDVPELDMSRDAYLGEYPWHPAYVNVDGGWDVGMIGKIATYSTVAAWHAQQSSHDYSLDDTLNLTIPAPALINGLQLRLADGHSLAYATAAGNVLFKDPSVEEPGFGAAIVDRKALQAFLRTHDKEIVWIFSGNKSAHGGRPHGEGWGGELSYWGIYRFKGDVLEGKLSFERREPRPQQLAELLAYP